MNSRPSTLPLMMADLLRIEPLASARVLHLAGPTRTVAQVILAETFDRLRRTPPHSLVVLHAEAATGGWSLAAALHLAWERNFAGVVVTSGVAGASSAALADRLNMSLLLTDSDPVDVALQLAGQISAPAATRALRQALCAERLTEQTSIRGVLSVLNKELGSTPVALVAGDAVLAGRASAIVERPDVAQVTVAVNGPGEPWARLVAGVPVNASVAGPHGALLKLARPSLLAAWAQTRLDWATHAAQEAAAFGLLRRLAVDARTPSISQPEVEIEAPSWSTDLGWQVDGANRAVWIAPMRSAGPPPAELTHLVRMAWQKGRPTWPLIAEDDGWISWQSGSNPTGTAPLRRALNSFAESAGSYQLAVGVGRAHNGVPGLLRSVAEARLAAHVARQGGRQDVQWFDQVGAPAALAWLPTIEIAKVADLCLSDLMAAHDRVALVDTALAVMDCGGSLVEASHRLGVHRNTVLARILRAKQLGLVFDDPTQRLALHVLCYALASLREPAPPVQ
ncbi:hypothetical protein ABIB25_000315 [Nakamurella sp. UYEF19]|uniref:PucR family transcriptional regulator n=1 Tax=Nakamurella sp. UYEF19 TaxID=1756392 RepID=UPI003393D3E7